MTAPRKDKPAKETKAASAETEASTEAAPAKAKPAKRERVTQNGIVRPTAGTATGNVWAHADRISGENKKPALRAEVLAACEAEGINSSTAATQYGRWCKFNGVVKPKATEKAAKAEAKEGEAETKTAPRKDKPASEEEDSFEE